MRSDPVIFEFAKSLRAPDADLEERLDHARGLFPTTDRTPDTVLVLSHAKRMKYNTELNNKLRPESAIYLNISAKRCQDECKPQPMWCWPGLVVIGRIKPCLKSQFYTVLSCDETLVWLQALTDARADGERPEGVVVNVPSRHATDVFRMSHSVTYCTSQGLSMRGVIALADVDSEHFELEHLNLGVTRATRSSLVEIRDC